MKRLHVPFLLLVLLLTSGCGRAGFGVAMFATGVLVGASSHHHHHRRVTYVEVDAPPPTVIVVPAPQSPSSRDAVPAPLPPSFDPIRARNALGNVDLTKCRAEGAPSVHGHAKVTYLPSGNISKVVIDQPGGLSLSAVTCIGRELGLARVESFEGTEVTVGTTWFVPVPE